MYVSVICSLFIDSSISKEEYVRVLKIYFGLLIVTPYLSSEPLSEKMYKISLSVNNFKV